MKKTNLIIILLVFSCSLSRANTPPAISADTDAIIIVKNGQTQLEIYQNGYTPVKKHILWSVSKSVTSLLYAAAEQSGKVSREDSICKYITQAPKEKCSIAFKNLLQFTSGLHWVEEYENTAEARKASVLAMLYGEGRRNMPAFVLREPMQNPSGAAWRYSSGDSILLSYALEKIYAPKSVHQAVREELFGPLGISDFTLETDGSGHVAGAYFFYLRPLDLLRLGQLLLKKGEWEGKQILPKQWLDFASAVPDAYFKNRLDHDEKNVGGGSFWLNKISGTGMTEKPWPELPDDALMALGHWGQYLLVVPSLNLVAVRLGNTRDKSFTSKNFASFVRFYL